MPLVGVGWVGDGKLVNPGLGLELAPLGCLHEHPTPPIRDAVQEEVPVTSSPCLAVPGKESRAAFLPLGPGPAAHVVSGRLPCLDPGPGATHNQNPAPEPKSMRDLMGNNQILCRYVLTPFRCDTRMMCTVRMGSPRARKPPDLQPGEGTEETPPNVSLAPFTRLGLSVFQLHWASFKGSAAVIE